MRILLHKLSDHRHALELRRPDGAIERVELDTRSFLIHDLLHYAVEAEAGFTAGFWGSVASGTTLAELKDRDAIARALATPEMLMIEQLVGVLTGALKGGDAHERMPAIEAYAGQLGIALPSWLSTAFIIAVQERMRRLLGRWAATPFHAAMELQWP